MRDLEEVYINFGRLGWPAFLPVTRLEMQQIFHAAEAMRERYPWSVIELMLQETESDLLLQAITDQVDSNWVSWATLTVALRGLHGESLPDIIEPE